MKEKQYPSSQPFNIRGNRTVKNGWWRNGGVSRKAGKKND